MPTAHFCQFVVFALQKCFCSRNIYVLNDQFNKLTLNLQAILSFQNKSKGLDPDKTCNCRLSPHSRSKILNSRVTWPKGGSIPRKVKKLYWEEDAPGTYLSIQKASEPDPGIILSLARSSEPIRPVRYRYVRIRTFLSRFWGSFPTVWILILSHFSKLVWDKN